MHGTTVRAALLSVARDLRHGCRILMRQPAFSAVAVATLALGIGATTTIFSVIQNVLLDPFDFNPERIVAVEIRDAAAQRPGRRQVFQLAEFLDYREQVHSFEDVIAGAGEDVVFSTADGAEQLAGGRVSVNNFTFLGVSPLLGRALEAGDAAPGAAPVFVAAHRAWLQFFGGDPQAVGRTFVLNGVQRTLVGVMGSRFRKLSADVYVPAALDRADPEDSRRFYLLQARLKRGVTLQQAESEVTVVARHLAKLYPQNYPERFAVRIVPLLDSVVGQFRTTLYTLAGAVALLMLIACVNVANMLLARATAREREMAVRAALGASRARLVRQLLLESLLIALCGAALGSVSAFYGIRAIAAAIPPFTIPAQAVLRLNGSALLFSLGAAFATALLCGIVPALRAVRRDVSEPLKDSSKGSTTGARRRRLTDVLVAAEVAISIVLLIGAGLLVRSFTNLQTVELGFNPTNVAVARLAFPPGRYTDAAAKGRFVDAVLARISALPGVTAAAATSNPPPFGGRIEMGVPGRTVAVKEYGSVTLCSEDYFAAVGGHLRSGRWLMATDVMNARKVAVVNQTLATRYFGSEDPLGRSILLTGLTTLRPPIAEPTFEIVGVVADISNQGVRDVPVPEAFIPHTLTTAFARVFVVRTTDRPEATLSRLRRAVWSVDRSIALTQSGTLAEFLDQFNYASPRLSVAILGAFAVTGLILVAAGLFSVLAYTVSRRTHEIGIRMALGADAANVVRLVLQTTLALIGVGVGVGLLGGLMLTRFLSAQLYGVTPTDPVTIVVVVGVIALVGLTASFVPVRQATRVDPMIALRHD
jgi:putative ABC transport system permease protein